MPPMAPPLEVTRGPCAGERAPALLSGGGWVDSARRESGGSKLAVAELGSWAIKKAPDRSSEADVVWPLGVPELGLLPPLGGTAGGGDGTASGKTGAGGGPTPGASAGRST